MTHLLRTDEGDPVEIATADGLPQGCPSAPQAFSMTMANPDDDAPRIIAEARVNPNAARLNRYMDDITLVTAPEAVETALQQEATHEPQRG